MNTPMTVTVHEAQLKVFHILSLKLFKTNLTREKIKEAPPEVLSEYEGIREEITHEITGVNEKETPKNK